MLWNGLRPRGSAPSPRYSDASCGNPSEHRWFHPGCAFCTGHPETARAQSHRAPPPIEHYLPHEWAAPNESRTLHITSDVRTASTASVAEVGGEGGLPPRPRGVPKHLNTERGACAEERSFVTKAYRKRVRSHRGRNTRSSKITRSAAYLRGRQHRDAWRRHRTRDCRSQSPHRHQGRTREQPAHASGALPADAVQMALLARGLRLRYA